MKANKIQKSVSGILSVTRKIVRLFNHRQAGSKNCQDASEYIIKHFKDHCHSLKCESFKLAPDSFLILPKLLVFCYLTGTFIWLFSQNLALLAIGIYLSGLFYMVTQFGLLFSLFDIFFPQKDGNNIVGILEPELVTKQQVILSSHHDSARICNFLEKKPRLYPFRITGALFTYITALFFSILSTLSISFNYSNIPVLLVLLLGGIIFILPLWWYNSKEISQGASDNLLSTILSLKISGFFKDIPLKHTRVLTLSLDGEEIGMKGAKNFLKNHHKEMTSTPTTVINIDSISKSQNLTLLTSDRNGILKLSSSLSKDIKDCAFQSGIDIQLKRFPIGGGGTDAWPFARAGFKTASLIGIPTNFNREIIHYHSSNDTVDAIEEKAVNDVFTVLTTFIKKIDQETF